MSASSFSKTKLIVAGSAVFVALALPMLQDGSFNSPISLISGAYAAEQGQGKGGSDARSAARAERVRRPAAVRRKRGVETRSTSASSALPPKRRIAIVRLGLA